MKGIDTNILVRYITRDDPDQTPMARRFLESECTSRDPGFVNAVVLVELAWVLERSYDRTNAEIAQVMDRLLRVDQIRVDRRDVVRSALIEFGEGDVEFADCLIGQLNHDAGCETTFTFDLEAAESAGWQALPF